MKKGFTLVELLVVVLIIGVLASVALPLYQRAVTKSRMAEMFLNLRKIEQIYEAYKLDPKDWTAEERSNYQDVIYLGEMATRTGIEPAGTKSDQSTYTTSHFIFSADEDHGGWEIMVHDKDNNFYCNLPHGTCSAHTELGKFYVSEIREEYPNVGLSSF